MKGHKFFTLLLIGLFYFSATADQVKLQLSASHPVLQSGQKNKTYLKVSMTGFEMKNSERPPVNLALVMDKSGSMSGDKIVRAREAAVQAIMRLKQDDIVSIVAYDSGVEVVVPATRISDRDSIINLINKIEAGGNTALFAGVSKGAAETRKFFAKNKVNRVILLSDGQANHGPSSPEALGELGVSLIREGISVSTIGLGTGYNEDLMARLASKSDGNHIFAETSESLIAAFNNEFGDVLSVVAQEVAIVINCAEGVRPVRVLGRDCDIAGQKVVVHLNQLYSNQEKFLLLEVEVSPGVDKSTRQLADCSISYANMQTEVTDKLSSALAVRFSGKDEDVEKNVNQATWSSCVSVIASIDNGLAVKLRDQGKLEEAKKILTQNSVILQQQLKLKPSKELEEQLINNYDDLSNIEDQKAWSSQRKKMLEYNRSNVYQQKSSQGYKTSK